MLDKHKLVQNPLIVLREETDDWAILFNPETANSIAINPTGVFIWKMINGNRNIKDIIKKIEKKFADVNKTEDIFDFIERLYQKGFIGYEV